MLGGADFQGTGVGLEALLSSDLDAVGQKGGRLFFRQGYYRHGFQKVINAEGRAVTGGACRGKGVARACDVVPENVGRVISEEEGPGVLDETDIAVGIPDHEAEMLRGVEVGEIDGLLDGVGDDDSAVGVHGLGEDIEALGTLTELGELRFDPLGEGGESVMRMDTESGSCSAWARMSAAHQVGEMWSSATVTASVGP